LSARPRKQTLPETDEMNVAVVMGGGTLIIISIIIGLAARNGALISMSLSVAVGAAVGWLAAGEASRRR
jgi:hypothetical protein